MNKSKLFYITFFTFAFLLYTFSLTSAAPTPMNGSYTIGSAGSNSYQTFAAAISDLETNGVNGPVLFKLVDNFYDEQIVLNQNITGSSATNTITFASATGDANDVEITSSLTNQIVYLQAVKHLVFENLTFTAANLKGVVLGYQIDGYVTFHKNIFNGSSNLDINNQHIISFSPGSNGYINNVSITSNDFINGDNGINFSSSIPGQNLNISNNSFSTKGSAISINNFDAPQIVENIVTNNSSNYAIYLENCTNSFIVKKNKISSTTNGGGGIKLINSNGSGSPRGIIVNNFIQAGNKGLQIESSNSVDVIHNSINISNSPVTQATGSSAFESLTNSDLVLYNNIFNNKRSGYGFIGSSGHFTTSDFNNLYTPGDYLFVWNNVEYKTLQTFQDNSGSGTEVNSYSVEVTFVSDTDLHLINSPVILNGKVTAVTNDIDGTARGTDPYVGAHEVTPMIGTYTIGNSSGNDFLTISDAITALYFRTINGAVTLKIKSGTYNEIISLQQAITGSSSTNTVTFTSNSQSASSVTITNSGNTVLNIDAVEYINFSKLTFTAPNLGRVLSSFGSLNHLSFNDNVFNGSTNIDGIIPTNQDVIFAIGTLNDVAFTNNTFNNGNNGLGFYHPTQSLGTLLDISGNTFSTLKSAIDLQHFDYPKIENNIITNNASDYAIVLRNIDFGFEIKNNKIDNTTNIGSGIRLYYTNGTSSIKGIVLNNFIQVGSKGITLENSSYIDIIHNSINIESASQTNNLSSIAFEGIGTYSDTRIQNNIFANKRKGYAYVGVSGTNITSDYNDLFTTGTNIAKWNGVLQPTLSDYVLASGTNNNSVSANPFFTSLTDLHADTYRIDDEGILVLNIPDIDGESRAVNPSIGADQFTATAIPVPLSGTYTIGTSGVFTSIAEALDDLYFHGIDGAVIFKILNGTYNEQIDLDGAITGSSATNTVTFQSNSGNAGDVEITHSASGTVGNFVVRINAAEHVKIKNLTLTAGGTNFAKVVSLENVTGNLEFFGNVMNGYDIASGGTDDQTIVLCDDSGKLNNTTFENNVINNGYNGIRLYLSSSTPHTTNLKIKGNTITTYYRCISINRASAPKILSNNLSHQQVDGLYLAELSNDFVVEKNIITGEWNGITIAISNGTNTLYGIVRNNFVQSTLTGIALSNSTYIDIFNNSINILGTNLPGNTAMNISGTSSNNIILKNNIFYNSAGGYAIHWEEGILMESNFNNLKTTGPILVKHASADYATLANWQSAPEGFDADSYNVDVTFVSSTDLHIIITAVPLNGTTLASVTEDIDGETRGTPPFIGADEPLGIDVNIKVYLEGPYNGTNNNMNVNLILPTTSPYSADPETVTSIPFISGNEVVDWVLVELRDKNNSSTVLESQSAFILQDGTIVDLDGTNPVHFTLPTDDYFIAVKHRNHLGIMSATAISL